MSSNYAKLRLKNLGINTYNEPIVYMREDCHICQAEGFQAPARVKISLNNKSLIATLNTVETDLLHHSEASLSTYAWNFLDAKAGDEISVTHPAILESLSYIRSKIYGNELSENEIKQIIHDLVTGQLSDIHVAMFLASSAGNRFSTKETLNLTRAMINSGQRLSWPSDLIVDKHCVGGLPGNRTSLIVVPIVAEFGLMIPKTSSRAITSPAGTADTMEVFAPVDINLKSLQKIVENQNGCIAWGGAVSLSPGDDLLIRIERVMNIDSEGQLVASILSKKIAAGSNHLVIDMPIGTTAKIRTIKQAELVKQYLESIADEFSIKLTVMMTDGNQPVGQGIGPALEAADVFAVLSGNKNAPEDLRDRSLMLAGHIIEFSPNVTPGTGRAIAKSILDSGKALKKFVAICEAQGGMFEIPKAQHTHEVVADHSGIVVGIDNRDLARIAKLAGAPNCKAAGVKLLVKLGEFVEKNQPLFVIHAGAKGALNYALSYLKSDCSVIQIEG